MKKLKKKQVLFSFILPGYTLHNGNPLPWSLCLNKGGREESYLAGAKVGRVHRMEGKEEEGGCVGTHYTEMSRIEAWEPRTSFSLTSCYPWTGAKGSWKRCTLPQMDFFFLSLVHAIWEHCPFIRKAGPLTPGGQWCCGEKRPHQQNTGETARRGNPPLL